MSLHDVLLALVIAAAMPAGIGMPVWIILTTLEELRRKYQKGERYESRA